MKKSKAASTTGRMVLAWGVPESIRTDCGTDYMSVKLRETLKSLGIKQIIRSPYQPQARGDDR